MTTTTVDCHVDQDTPMRVWDGTRREDGTVWRYPTVAVVLADVSLFFDDVADLDRLIEHATEARAHMARAQMAVAVVDPLPERSTIQDALL